MEKIISFLLKDVTQVIMFEIKFVGDITSMIVGIHIENDLKMISKYQGLQ